MARGLPPQIFARDEGKYNPPGQCTLSIPPSPLTWISTMSTGFSRAPMAEAEEAIQRSQGYQARKGERFLNRLGIYPYGLSTASINSFCQVTKLLPFQTRPCRVLPRQRLLIQLRARSATLPRMPRPWLRCWTRWPRCTHSSKVCRA